MCQFYFQQVLVEVFPFIHPVQVGHKLCGWHCFSYKLLTQDNTQELSCKTQVKNKMRCVLRLTCPCKSVLRSITAHVRANTAPEDTKTEQQWHMHHLLYLNPHSCILDTSYDLTHLKRSRSRGCTDGSGWRNAAGHVPSPETLQSEPQLLEKTWGWKKEGK